MSTYYWLCCDQHREVAPACSRSAGAVGPLHDMADCLSAFCFSHKDCVLRIVREQTHEADEFQRWTKANVEQMEALEREGK